MKKGIIVLLITVLAAGMAFASFSGSANVQFNADLDSKQFGFASGKGFSFSFTVDSEVANLDGESPIHAVAEATANLIVAPRYGSNGSSIWVSNNSSYGLGLLFSLKTAKIVGENWSVDILGAKSAYDYASASYLTVPAKYYSDSFSNTYDDEASASYTVPYSKAPGLTVSIDDLFTASFGFYHYGEDVLDDKTEKVLTKASTAISATLETKEFAFSDDMFKVQAAAEVSKGYDTPAADALTNVGLSAKGSFAMEDVSVDVAADFGFEGIGGDDVKVQFDASLAAAYDFLSASAYLFKGTELASYKDLYLEAALEADLNKFEVPVSVSAYAMNIIDKSEAGVDLGVSAAYSADAISAGASFDINSDSKVWGLNVYGIYAAEKFEAGANVKYASSSKAVSFGAYAESSALIEGAKLGLGYGLKNFMTFGGSSRVAAGYNSNSFGSEETVAGAINAYCKISF